MSKSLLFACARNEGPYLAEWVSFHRNLGFTNIAIFSNDCDDGTVEICDAMQSQNLIIHVRNDGLHKKGPQWSALNSDALKALLNQHDIAMHLDLDEFLAIHRGKGRFPDLIEKLGPSDIMVLPWRNFGNGDISAFKDIPITQQFIKCMDPDAVFPRHVFMYKSLFRIKPQEFRPGIHGPKPLRSGAIRALNGSGQPMSKYFRLGKSVLPPVDRARDVAEVFHYPLRSREAFLVKRDRGLPSNRTRSLDLSYWAQRNFADLDETKLSRIADQTEQSRKDLIETAGIADLHQKSCEWHSKRAEEIRATPDGIELWSDLAISGSSRHPPVDEAKEIYGLLQQVYMPSPKK